MKVFFSNYTNQGNRDINEDSISITKNKGSYCFILCDGLGGHGKGELASRYITQFLAKYFNECNSMDEFFADAFEKAQDGLLAEQKKIGAQFEMKTTAVVLVIDHNEYRYAHIGDSRLYHFRRNKVLKRTLDHSVPQMLAIAGDIKEKQIRSHPDRNRLLRVMGIEWDEPRYELSEKGLIKEGDAFLLCSDGFWEPIIEKEMCRLLKRSSSVDEWINNMRVTVINNAQGTNMDNYSAIAIICGKD